MVRKNDCLNAAKACNLNDTCKKYRSAYISPCTSRVSTAEVCNKRKCHKALRQFFDKARRFCYRKKAPAAEISSWKLNIQHRGRASRGRMIFEEGRLVGLSKSQKVTKNHAYLFYWAGGVSFQQQLFDIDSVIKHKRCFICVCATSFKKKYNYNPAPVMSLWNYRGTIYVNVNENKCLFVVLECHIVKFTVTPLYLIQLSMWQLAVHVTSVCVSGKLASFF